VLPADQGHDPRRVQGLEAALDGALAEDAKGGDRPGEALDGGRRHVLELEQLAQEPAGGLSDQHRARAGERLQAVRQVGRIADDGFLLRSPGAHEVADHD
jgi:hypothetical protein